MLRVKRFTSEDDAYTDSLELRENHLRVPLGLSLRDEDLSSEPGQMHFGLFDGVRLVGSVIFKVLGDTTVKLRQLVVDEGMQGMGCGTQLVTTAEKALREMGYTEVELAARYGVRGFYGKLGYMAEGEIFQEVGIDHIKMVKSI